MFINKPSKVQYVVAGGVDIFPFEFKWFDETDIKVYRTPVGDVANDANDILDDTDYTITSNASKVGGSIEVTIAVTDGDVVTVARDLPFTRTVDFVKRGSFTAKTINDDQDYQSYLLQDLEALSNSYLQLPISSGVEKLLFPSPEAGNYIRWSASGDTLENVSSAISIVDRDTFVVPTVDDLSVVDFAIISTVVVSDIARGGIFEYDDAVSTVNNNGTIFDGWVRQYDDDISVKWFGAICDGVTDDSGAMLLAISVSEKLLLPSDTNCPNLSITDIFNVVFVGNGKLLNVYRKDGYDTYGGGKNTVISNDIIPSKHLKVFNNVFKPKVVLVGDSISTYLANSVSRGNMLTSCLEDSISLQGNNGIEFYNRAIGGKTFNNLQSVLYQDYIPWYSGLETTTWIDVVKALEPDLIVFSLGMNDAENIKVASIKAVIDYIKTWAKVPSLVMATNLTPNPLGASEGTEVASQTSRDLSAGLVRSYVKANDIGLLDFHRQGCVARDGYDPTSSTMAVGEPDIYAVINGTAKECVGTKNVSSFKAKIWANPMSIGGFTFTVRTGTGANDFIQFSKTGATNLAILSYAGNTDSIGTTYNISTFSFPTEVGYLFTIEKINDVVTIYLDDDTQFGTYNEPLIRFNVVSCGGEFLPKVKGSSLTSIESIRIYYGEYIKNTPLIENTILWGDGDTSYVEGYYGGSGWNHPSEFVAGLIYEPVLSNSKWFYGNEYVTKLTALLTVDSLGNYIFTVPHGLPFVPNVDSISLALDNGVAIDWEYNLFAIDATNSTNVYVRIKVTTASVTSGATADILITIRTPK